MLKKFYTMTILHFIHNLFENNNKTTYQGIHFTSKNLTILLMSNLYSISDRFSY